LFRMTDTLLDFVKGVGDGMEDEDKTDYVMRAVMDVYKDSGLDIPYIPGFVEKIIIENVLPGFIEWIADTFLDEDDEEDEVDDEEE
jgi:hypothetical protein